MAGSGDDLFDDHDEAGEAAEELTEASCEDARATATPTEGDVAGAAPAAIDDAHGSVGGGKGSASDGAARPSEAATGAASAGSSGAASGSSAPQSTPLTMKARIALLKEEQKLLRATSKATLREIWSAETRSNHSYKTDLFTPYTEK